MPVTVIEQSFQIHGVKYKMEEDGSIGFYNGEDLVFSIPRPVMYEFNNPENKSYGLHYEITERGEDYLLRKIIDDLHWLQKAQYPVVIDSSTQGEIADPWEQQGLTPYGQYFKNLNEYVDPLTGHLTIRHTDYSLSGRGQEATYMYGSSGRIAKKVSGLIDYYHTDHLGSTRLVTDEQGNVVSEVQYKAFGETDEEEEDYLFTGKEKDSSGLYYYGARYYDPEIGRFISRDPRFGGLQDPQRLNRYVYCLNNPLKYKDPDRKDPLHYNGPIYYDEDEQTLAYSHVPQLIVYVDCEEGYEWFVAFCIVAGVILAIATAPHVLPILGEYLVALGKVLASAGSKVAWAVIRVLDKLTTSLVEFAKTDLGKTIIGIIIAVITYIIMEIRSGNEDIDSVELYDEEGNYIGTNVISKKMGDFAIKGIVIFSNGEKYEWKWSGGVYYVKIDGEWVPVSKEGWDPGDEIPEDLLEDEVKT